MVNDYLRLPSAPIWGTPHSTGDGQRMAQAIGADLWHMGNMMTQMGIDTDGWGTYLSLFSANSFLHVHDEDRKSVVTGKSVSVRVVLGGRRIIKTKKQKKNT